MEPEAYLLRIYTDTYWLSPPKMEDIAIRLHELAVRDTFVRMRKIEGLVYLFERSGALLINYLEITVDEVDYGFAY